MRKLLNTLYVTSENSYLALDGENRLYTMRKKNWEDCLYTIWMELFLLDIGEPVRR